MKKKTPNIDPRVLARPRLEALFERHARGELDDDGLLAAAQALLAEKGMRPVALDALVKRMEGTPELERETLMRLVERLRSPEVIAYLWDQVKKPKTLSLEAKTTALVILKQMGEAVDLADPSQYFPPQDLRPSDLKSTEKLLRQGMRGLAREVRAARDPVEADYLMAEINRLPESALDGEGALVTLAEQAEAEASDLGADFLYALAYATPYPAVEQAAQAALARLAAAGIRPVTPAILSLGQERFHAAYMSDPDHPWQQSINVTWERTPGVVQALVFLLDFGLPWGGALKDVFPTGPMTPTQYHRELVENAQAGMGERMYHIRLSRAQAAITAAVAANRQHKVALPEDFHKYRRMIERWALHPSAAALAADTTVDELGDRPLAPDRGNQPLMVDLRGGHASETLRALEAMNAQSGKEFRFESDAAGLEKYEIVEGLDTFDDVSAAVHEQHAEFVTASNLWGPAWTPEVVVDYLASLCPDEAQRQALRPSDDRLIDIGAAWDALQSFFFYLDDHVYEIGDLAEVRAFHIAEHVRENSGDLNQAERRQWVEDLLGLFAYLAAHGLLPADAPALKEFGKILAKPEKVDLPQRPAPLGGELAFREYAASSASGQADDWSDETPANTLNLAPLTYNGWWLALLLGSDFADDADRFRRAAAGQPDAPAKLALLDELLARIALAPHYLETLEEYRPAAPADYARAKRWFKREKVNRNRAG